VATATKKSAQKIDEKYGNSRENIKNYYSNKKIQFFILFYVNMRATTKKESWGFLLPFHFHFIFHCLSFHPSFFLLASTMAIYFKALGIFFGRLLKGRI
jgi:hypothetical protein